MVETIAGIVTYNPDLTRLTENVAAIAGQVSEIVVFDNGSSNNDIIKATLSDKCKFIDNPLNKNLGIASALNEICRYASDKGYDWVLTLDQDSVCPDNIISEYSKHLSISGLGILSPRILDRNIGDIDGDDARALTRIDACITSASLLNVQAWKEVGGFWDELFIDMVDFDICWSLQKAGYKVFRVNSVSLLHELGHSVKKNFRGNDIAVFNHSPLRYYYIARNTIAVGRKYNRRYQCFRWNLKRLYLLLRPRFK